MRGEKPEIKIQYKPLNKKKKHRCKQTTRCNKFFVY